MEIYEISEIAEREYKIITEDFRSTVILLNNGDYAKTFTYEHLTKTRYYGIDIERLIRDAKPIKNVPEIITPHAMITDKDKFVGFITRPAKGIPLDLYFEKLIKRPNLQIYNSIFENIENIVLRGNDNNIVFPDLATIGNIFIDENDRLEMIDYDGIQIGDTRTLYIPKTICDGYACYTDGKYLNNKKFTPELDKKSIIYAYMKYVFHIEMAPNIENLESKDEIEPLIKEIFTSINLDDEGFMHKIMDLYYDDKPNGSILSNIKSMEERYFIVDGARSVLNHRYLQEKKPSSYYLHL